LIFDFDFDFEFLFGTLVHLVGFAFEVRYDARPYEHQISPQNFIQ